MVESAAELDHQPVVHIAVQNAFYTKALTCEPHAARGVTSISGHWFLQENCCGPDDIDCTEPPCGSWTSSSYLEFAARTQTDVECRLGRLLRNDAATASPYFGGVHRPDECGGQCPEDCYRAPDLTKTIIIDVEKPHLKNLHLYDPNAGNYYVQREVVRGFKRRIAAAKSVFPAARLGLYGTLNPDELGDETDGTFVDRKRALVRAGAWGLYDDLWYLVPVLYTRFGCNNVQTEMQCEYPAGDNDCDPRWVVDGALTLREYTDLGVTASTDLSPGKPLLPLLSVRVANGFSCFKDVLYLDMFRSLGIAGRFDATLQEQLDVLQLRGVGEAALWIGGVDDVVLPEPNVGSDLGNKWRVTHYTNQLCP